MKKKDNQNNTFLYKTANDRLKSDLDEVEELTTRVRNSISIDLSSTRRYSPLLYEYYRKQLELARSIQSTYNIQCNTLFDAMTLMKKCLKDYCQTVHNPEYVAIDTININKVNDPNVFQFNFNDFMAKNAQTLPTQMNPNFKGKTPELLNNTFLTNLSSEQSSSNSVSSSTSLSKHSNTTNNVHNLNYELNIPNVTNIDNKQTYV